MTIIDGSAARHIEQATGTRSASARAAKRRAMFKPMGWLDALRARRSHALFDCSQGSSEAVIAATAIAVGRAASGEDALGSSGSYPPASGRTPWSHKTNGLGSRRWPASKITGGKG
jgi:hypothetical protein